MRPVALQIAALLAVLGALTARSLELSRAHPVPVYDEVEYMQESRELASLGPLGSLACYYRGACRLDKRTPLYELLVARAMRGGPADFARAKLVTLATSWLLILLAYLCAGPLWGGSCALAAAAMLGLSASLALRSQEVLADVLYAALFFAALARLLYEERRGKGWAGFGALAGAAYLAKGSGHVLLVAPAVLAAARARERRPWLGRAAAAVGAFALVASPLLARNLRVWGTPFHNFNDKVLWLDDMSSLWRYWAKPQLWSEVSFSHYVRAHSAAEMAGRLLSGCSFVGREVLENLCGLPGDWGAGLGGYLLLAAAAWGVSLEWRAGRRAQTAAVLAPCALLFAAHGWAYQMGMRGTRYMLPAAAVLCGYAAVGLRDALMRALEPGPRVRELAAPALVAGAAVAALLASSGGLAADPRTFWSEPPNWRATADWIKANVDAKGYLSSNGSRFAIWDVSPEADPRHPTSFEVYDADLLAFADFLPVDFILADTAEPSYAHWPQRLGRPDEYGPTTYLGWPRVFHDPLRPSELSVYRRPGVRQASPKARAPAAPSRSSR